MTHAAADLKELAPDTTAYSVPRLWRLFLASFAALYFELLVIRYVSTEVRAFVTLKNLPLIASFFGIGAGMLRRESSSRSKVKFVFAAACLFLIARFGSHVPTPTLAWNYVVDSFHGSRSLTMAIFLAVVMALLWVIVELFEFLGALIGTEFKQAALLPAYGCNLAGSLAGMLTFTAVSFLHQPPAIWLAIGFAALIPFFWRNWIHLAIFAGLIVSTGLPQADTYWSPYHRIDIRPIQTPGWSRPSAYSLSYNHLWYQSMADLSQEFVSRYPEAEPNRMMRAYYELPYEFARKPRSVLLVGAGTGNDVAAALRHGAEHVDAVEIDPVIFNLGRRFHPEDPYGSPKVTGHIDDARAFFQNTNRRYDLIVFGFLDSSTLLTGFSSIRLDNYVYTRESFAAARKLLTPDGTMVLSFATVRSYVADRLYATVAAAFEAEPRAFLTSTNVMGMVFVEGAGRAQSAAGVPGEITEELSKARASTIVMTDSWPFLYLERRSIPPALLAVLLYFLLMAWVRCRKDVRREWNRGTAQFFLLGAGFLLLETKAITQLSLLFGSTWVVNAVVISAFLIMALAANALVMYMEIKLAMFYPVLVVLVATGAFIPYSVFGGVSLPFKLLAAGLWAALPVFFSGAIFSSVFRGTTSPRAALGFNLLGAVVGGMLENTAMIGGSLAVGLLATLCYGLAWAWSGKRREMSRA